LVKFVGRNSGPHHYATALSVKVNGKAERNFSLTIVDGWSSPGAAGSVNAKDNHPMPNVSTD
jgi:hypothetical protein